MSDSARWTAAMQVIALRMRREGYACKEIAQAVHRETGVFVSRNAVIGWLHRQPCAQDETVRDRASSTPLQSPVRRRPRQAPEVKPRVVSTVWGKPEPDLAVPVSLSAREGVSYVCLVDVKAGQCRWPYGDPRSSEFRFCGAVVRPPTTRGRQESFCPHHASLAYEPRRTKEAT